MRQEKIHRLKEASGNIITDNSSLLKEIHKFYHRLYSDDGDQRYFDDFLDDIEFPKRSDVNKSTLDLPISKSELYKTFVSMKQNKTLGFDGFPVEFFIVFWQDVSDMLIDSYNFSLKNGLLPLSQRNGIITLLSKKDKDPLLVKNYTPITLLTVDYKIMAKTLAKRLRLCINDMIHSDQSGFIKGRNIGDNISLIMDIIEYTESNNISGAILLLDIEKAFDTVSDDFFI